MTSLNCLREDLEKLGLEFGADGKVSPLGGIYTAGQKLPANAECVEVRTQAGTRKMVCGGENLPLDMIGWVAVEGEGGAHYTCCQDSASEGPIEKAFGPNEFLPAYLVDPVKVLLDDGTEAVFSAGDQLPSNMAGWVFIDDKTGEGRFSLSETVVPQITFLGGDTYPDTASGPVTVILDDGTTATVNPGEEFPANMVGSVTVDPQTGVADLHGWEDHHGTHLAMTADTPLHKSLVIGAGHVDPGSIGVSALDSSEDDTGVVTTHHMKAVLASLNSRVASTSAGIVVASNASNIIGSVQDANFASIMSSVISDIDGNYSSIIGSFDAHIIRQNNVVLSSQAVTVDATLSSTMAASAVNVIDGTHIAAIATRGATIDASRRIFTGASSSVTAVNTAMEDAATLATQGSTLSHSRAALVSTLNRATVRATTLHTDALHIFGNYLYLKNLPTTSPPAGSGQAWNSGGVVRIA